jgi:hypothetical protein
MAQSTCPNPECKGHSFQLSENSPSGSAFKLQFVQCSNCGTVVGVLESHNSAVLIQKLANALNVRL